MFQTWAFGISQSANSSGPHVPCAVTIWDAQAHVLSSRKGQAAVQRDYMDLRQLENAGPPIGAPEESWVQD